VEAASKKRGRGCDRGVMAAVLSGYVRRTPHRGLTQLVRAWILLDLVPLHLLHAAMRLEGSAVPPIDAGMMWSTVSASAPQ